jgi:hypothetical protein
MHQHIVPNIYFFEKTFEVHWACLLSCLDPRTRTWFTFQPIIPIFCLPPNSHFSQSSPFFLPPNSHFDQSFPYFVYHLIHISTNHPHILFTTYNIFHYICNLQANASWDLSMVDLSHCMCTHPIDTLNIWILWLHKSMNVSWGPMM